MHSDLSLLHSKIRQQELSFHSAQRALQDQLFRLQRQLELESQSRDIKLNDLQYSISQQQQSYLVYQQMQISKLQQQLLISQQEKFALKKHSEQTSVQSQYHLRKLKDENYFLKSEYQRLVEQKQSAQESLKKVTQVEIRSREQSLAHNRRVQMTEMESSKERNMKEQNDLEQEVLREEHKIRSLQQDITQVTYEMRKEEESNYLKVRDYKRQIFNQQNELEYLEINNRLLLNDKQEVRSESQQYSDQAASFEAQLHQLKVRNAQLKPKVQRLEKLVYGKGVSPKKSPVKRQSSTKSPIKREPTSKSPIRPSPGSTGCRKKFNSQHIN